ncbi:hypothetical protein DL766_006878 [Monosporascus sp. MC13-8B]|uniref:Uncharacterized protein n=1 Tax=Monosporascus cannonballus TaxID=155416 RepID=A0ABY0GT58_9PEZI|nr:hypothetical protein DL762_009521 [Monosporascus cannonballus]RYO78611.1 hypothetical protein DL763_009575 [Monosporascus cannonballus]RYP25996.1 hypothetical protein DL766_006878 [Monosporascus sp. MC13-8B]
MRSSAPGSGDAVDASSSRPRRAPALVRLLLARSSSRPKSMSLPSSPAPSPLPLLLLVLLPGGAALTAASLDGDDAGAQARERLAVLLAGREAEPLLGAVRQLQPYGAPYQQAGADEGAGPRCEVAEGPVRVTMRQ